MATHPVVIVGGGLAGLCCARVLHDHSVPFTVLEASDDVGGRVRTDEVDGFLLDRGFQVLLTAYPETRDVLDYERLELKPFTPGALIRVGGRFQRIADPWQQPSRIIETILSEVGSLADKVRIGRLRAESRRGSLEELFQRRETTTVDELRRIGFSERMIDRFFRPFLGGVFLEPQLETSSRMLHFVFRMFSAGETALPAKGMGQIPEQIAAALPSDSVRLNSAVESIDGTSVGLKSGERLDADSVVIATDEQTAARLLPKLGTPRRPRPVSCLYFAAAEPPLTEPILVLNGEGSGPVNNLCVPSEVSPRYSPPGQALISATVLERGDLDDRQLESSVRSQLTEWYGPRVGEWRLLCIDHIPWALPDQSPPLAVPSDRPGSARENVYLCGDYRQQGSIHGAMVSGRLAAEALIAQS